MPAEIRCWDKWSASLAILLTFNATSGVGPNAATRAFHNDGPTACEAANRRIFMDTGFKVSYILPIG
jgi:hypothetical protein